MVRNYRPGAANHRLTMLSNLLNKQMHKQQDVIQIKAIQPTAKPIQYSKYHLDTQYA